MSLTHGQRRAKHRAGTPRAKRRAKLTSKMRELSMGEGTRRFKHGGALALRIMKNKIKEHSYFYVTEHKLLLKHKARVPGTIRLSRMPGGPGFRNNWEWDQPKMAEAAMKYAL